MLFGKKHCCAYRYNVPECACEVDDEFVGVEYGVRERSIWILGGDVGNACCVQVM